MAEAVQTYKKHARWLPLRGWLGGNAISYSVVTAHPAPAETSFWTSR